MVAAGGCNGTITIGSADVDGSGNSDSGGGTGDGPGGTGDGDTSGGGTDDAPGTPPGSDDPPTPPPSDGRVLAFPGATGFGANATGGRGGDVIKVTTLAASGPGSLQAALDRSGPRIIVFEVSGVIEGDILIPNGDVTIAGQTAPGGGITLQGRLIGRYSRDVGNIIIRHMRIRPEYRGSDGAQFDAVQLSRNTNFILDHMSIGFGVDETVDMFEAIDATVQWTTIEQAGTVGHPEGEHNYGLINGPDGRRVSVHHTLFAHNKNRNPAIANGPSEVVNNVIHNVRHGFIHQNAASGQFNIVGNYYKDGPSGTLIPFFFDDEAPRSSTDPAYYLADNFVDDASSSCPGVVTNPWRECNQDLFLAESHRAAAVHDFSDIATYVATPVQPVRIAYDDVLTYAGAFPRDVVTETSVAEVRAGTGEWGARFPADLMAGLTPTAPPVDSDNDGMSDAFEIAQGLDPNDGSDHTTIMPSGYTAIEDYINGLAEGLLP